MWVLSEAAKADVADSAAAEFTGIIPVYDLQAYI